MQTGELVRLIKGSPLYEILPTTHGERTRHYMGFLVESGLGVEVWREPGVSRDTDGGLQLWSQVLLGGRLVWTTTGMLYDMEGNKL